VGLFGFGRATKFLKMDKREDFGSAPVDSKRRNKKRERDTREVCYCLFYSDFE